MFIDRTVKLLQKPLHKQTSRWKAKPPCGKKKTTTKHTQKKNTHKKKTHTKKNKN